MKTRRRPRLKFETKRFIIRPYLATDYITWRRAYENMLPKQSEFDDDKKSERELSRVEFRKLLRKYSDWRKTERILFLGVFEKKTGRLIGYTLISLIERFNVQSARIAYFIFNNYWKHGFGKEATLGTIDFAFRKLKLHRIEAEIQPHNRASVGLVNSLGFQFEGLRRKAVYFNRAWHDHVIYALIADDLGIKNTKPIFYS